MSHDVTAPAVDHPCEVHKSHRPRPHRTVRHHIQPLGMGGPDVDANKVWTCDNGHYDVHDLLGKLIAADGDWSKIDDRTYHPNERSLAKQGFDEWVAAGKPGTPEAIARGGAAED